MIAPLHHRKLIRFGGPEAVDFLNDLITASVPGDDDDGVRQAALLTPQGRILFDMLICRARDDVLIELDEARAQDFMKKMMMYRLRRDVSITADDTIIYAVVGQAEETGGICRRDTRFAEPVFRVYSTMILDASASGEDWQAYRYLHGVAEGAHELPPEKALPLEARLDLNDGISFQKGCYIGQEVTARTRYRGLIKRCYLPIRMTDPAAIPCDLMADGKLVGEVFGIAAYEGGFIGLAAIRLDALESDIKPDVAGQMVEVMYPERLMPLPERTKK